MKLIALFTLLIPSLAYAGERPASAPPIDERLTGIEKINSDQDTEIAELKHKIESLQLAIKCPCGRGGKCICGEDCQCPNCPEHGKADPRVQVLSWSASWCGPCKVGETAATKAGLYDKLVHYDWDCETDRKTADLAGVDKIPALVLVIDDKVVDRHFGSEGYVETIREWLKVDPDSYAKKPVKESRVSTADDGDGSDDQIRQHLVDAHGYAWSEVSGMNRSQLKAAHDRGHGGPAVVAKNYPVRRYSQPTVRYTQPIRYRPRTYYQPSYGGCYGGSCSSCR